MATDYVLPSRAHHTDDELAGYGAMFHPGRLVEGARERITLARQDLAVFGPYQFDTPWLDAMGAQLDLLTRAKASRVQTQLDARPSGIDTDKALHGVEAWVRQYNAAVVASPDPAVAQKAPHPARHWDNPKLVEGEVRPLIEFARTHAELATPGGHTALATAGDTALQTFVASRTQHQGAVAQLSPEVKQLHIAEGLVAYELARLARVAQQIHAAHAHQYALARLRPATHAHADAAPPAAPAA